MNKKDQLIEETLNSFKSIQKAEADPFLYEKVMNRMQLRSAEARNYSWNYRWQIAALFLLLIINSYFVLRSDTNTSQQNDSTSFATEYFGKGNTYNY